MLDECVVLLARLLVLRERRPAARTPLGRAMALVQPAARVHLLEEAPDVLDVRVREGEVVVAPVHPHAEALRLLDHHRGVVRDALAALRGELGQAIRLDLALRVEPECLLHLDLDMQALGVEAVLVARVEPVHGLVALEDVLQRAAVAVVDAHRVVGGDRPVHEGERAGRRGSSRGDARTCSRAPRARESRARARDDRGPAVASRTSRQV